MKVTITPRAIFLLGSTFTEIGTFFIRVSVPVVPVVVDEVCEVCGSGLVPLIGDTPQEVRAMFCENCEFGI
ncbi:hypothetical protein [Streptomyces sp. NPDC047070]|uniref:hypothetical protein n=1 Tax=Streptomyces sp. NPDC047070 TaxID=3154923 RepID=UPI0034533C7F